MGDSYIIDGKLLMILGGYLSLVVGTLVWLARASLKRIESGLERVDKKIDAKFDELGRKSDARADRLGEKIDAKFDELGRKSDARADRLGEKIDAKFGELGGKSDARADRFGEKMDGNFDRLGEKIDAKFDELGGKSDARADRLSEKMDAKADATSARLEAKIDGNFDKLGKKSDDNHDELDKKSEERHREVQATLLDLTYKVGKLAGAVDARDGSADQSRQSSLRRNNDPAPTPSGAPDPARIAERYDRSMVPLAGVRPEPGVPAGLVRQAAPGQNQTGQQDSETGPEPHAEDAPDATR